MRRHGDQYSDPCGLRMAGASDPHADPSLVGAVKHRGVDATSRYVSHWLIHSQPSRVICPWGEWDEEGEGVGVGVGDSVSGLGEVDTEGVVDCVEVQDALTLIEEEEEEVVVVEVELVAALERARNTNAARAPTAMRRMVW